MKTIILIIFTLLVGCSFLPERSSAVFVFKCAEGFEQQCMAICERLKAEKKEQVILVCEDNLVELYLRVDKTIEGLESNNTGNENE